ncbi:MAG TPA: hypothetical protein VN428_04395 [Bryobacteraceae bacterium]|nr:hypothetical protein [Bryobacteraceae bacterium]
MPSAGGRGRRGGGASASASDWGGAVPSGSATAGPGDMGARPSGPAPVKFQVRWVAAPVREALRIAKAPEIRPELFEQYYVVTVFQTNAQHRPDGVEGLSQKQSEQLKQATALHVKGMEPLRPEMVGLTMTAEGRTTVFLFPRKSGIGLDNKAVEFNTHFGPMEIKSKFDVKRMVWNGATAL